MKGQAPLLAAALLIAAAIGLAQASDPALGKKRAETLLQKRLSGLTAAEVLPAASPQLTPQSPAPSPSPAPETSPEPANPVPVETVEEAWDEEARRTGSETPRPSAIRLEGEPSLELRNETAYAIDFTSLPALPSGMELDTPQPVVLIMHTHGTESYAESVGDQSGSVFRSQDETQSVIAVGEVLKAALETRGYKTIHDKTLCDSPEYTGAYSRSRAVVQENLSAYPSIVLVLDIHRDAVENPDGTQMRMACTIDGAGAGQLMLVVGTDAGGLEHPGWRENLSLAAVLQTRLSAAVSDIMRPLNLRTERFNQDLAPLSLLVEVGASGNTLEEAKKSASLFGGVLADVFDDYLGKGG